MGGHTTFLFTDVFVSHVVSLLYLVYASFWRHLTIAVSKHVEDLSRRCLYSVPITLNYGKLSRTETTTGTIISHSSSQKSLSLI